MSAKSSQGQSSSLGVISSESRVLLLVRSSTCAQSTSYAHNVSGWDLKGNPCCASSQAVFGETLV